MAKVAPEPLVALALAVRRARRGEAIVASPTAARVVVVSAHPDDEVLMAGGTIAMMVRGGAAIEVIVATDGEASVGSSLPGDEVRRRRRAEAVAGCAVLGLGSPRFLGLPDGGLAARVDDLAAVIAATVGPGDVIVCPWWLDGHADHRAVAAAVAAARLPEGVEVWAGEIWTPLVPNRVVDISAVIETKRSAIACHTTAAEAFDLSAALGLSRYRALSGLRGVGYGEAFVALPAAAFAAAVIGIPPG
jgi:LmbE family N-acetylglucosaminyl deacetylase